MHPLSPSSCAAIAWNIYFSSIFLLVYFFSDPTFLFWGVHNNWCQLSRMASLTLACAPATWSRQGEWATVDVPTIGFIYKHSDNIMSKVSCRKSPHYSFVDIRMSTSSTSLYCVDKLYRLYVTSIKLLYLFSANLHTVSMKYKTSESMCFDHLDIEHF